MSVQTRAESAVAEFYESTKKNRFLNKNSQKFECAESVSGKIAITELMEATMFRVSGAAPRLMFRYNIFKAFAEPNNYEAITLHVLSLFAAEIAAEGSFELHVDLVGATVSAVDRYRPFFEFFLAYCETNNIEIAGYVSSITVYNTPSFIQTSTTLLQTFVDKRLISLVQYVSKADSAERVEALLA